MILVANEKMNVKNPLLSRKMGNLKLVFQDSSFHDSTCKVKTEGVTGVIDVLAFSSSTTIQM